MSIFAHFLLFGILGLLLLLIKLKVCIQKIALKRIRNEISVSHSVDELYYLHCKPLNILPIKFRFIYHDREILYEITNGFSCVTLPDYHKFHAESTRLRRSHRDQMSPVSDIAPRGNIASSNRCSLGNSCFSIDLKCCGVGCIPLLRKPFDQEFSKLNLSKTKSGVI